MLRLNICVMENKSLHSHDIQTALCYAYVKKIKTGNCETPK